MNLNPSLRPVGFLVSLLTAPLALAQAPAPLTPPQEAVDACAGREAGASCSFEHDGHTVGGRCRAVPGGTTLACAARFGHLHPPPEALEACRNQQEGATCQFTSPRGDTIAGVCRTGPQGEPAACLPKNPPPFGPGPGAGNGG
jgi:hypothetical protein